MSPSETPTADRGGTNLDRSLSTGTDPPTDVTAAECYVLGGGRVGEAVTTRLRLDGYTAALIDEAHDPVDIPGVRADPADVQTLTEVGLSDAATVVVATREDTRNLLIAQLVRTNFDVDEVVVLANVPDRIDALEAAGHRPVCATTALSGAITERL